jgi:pseudouridylate synthase
MRTQFSKHFMVAPQVARALAENIPVVALESTVISHGLPYPDNLTLAKDMEAVVSKNGAVPATIALIDGNITVGLSDELLERLATDKNLAKISTRDLSSVISKGQSGGTTVAASIFIAHAVGIKVFATGGIGGVHRDASFDISMDLLQLAQTPIIVVCAGAKAILDLPATLEYLETHGVPVIGFRTSEFPAFYSRHSGLPTSTSAETPNDVAQLAAIHYSLGLKSALLIALPIPEQEEIPTEEIQGVIERALKDAKEAGIHGQHVTPYLLSRVSELSDQKSLRANLALLKNNARIAAQIACAINFD